MTNSMFEANYIPRTHDVKWIISLAGVFQESGLATTMKEARHDCVARKRAMTDELMNYSESLVDDSSQWKQWD